MFESNKIVITVQKNVLRLAMAVYDIAAIHIAFYLTMMIRFYVGNEFHSVAAKYMAMYNAYAPFYTVFCIAVFAAFKLYSGIWKYAGLSDFNRILAANAICLIAHVAGTLLFSIRMPISVYCMGTVLQFVMVAAVRFLERFLMVEKYHLEQGRHATVNAMIVGAGGTGRSVVKQLERVSTTRPVCVLDYNQASIGSRFDGLPVVNGEESIGRAIETYHVNLVIIASTTMPAAKRAAIKEACSKAGVEVQDYSGFFDGVSSGLTLNALAECAVGEVEVIADGESRLYDDCEQALLKEAGRHKVKTVRVKNGRLTVELTDNQVVRNDLNADWVKEHELETNEAISFF